MSDDVIDRATLERLLETVGGDRAFLAELIDAFFADAPQQLAAMRRALANRDADELRRAAHSLKSNSANLGALKLAELCKDLETLAKSGGLDDGAARLLPIEAEYARVQRALQAARGETG